MIVTLTPNPSVDRSVEVDRLERGGVHRATGHREDPGGKGINVALALRVNGHASRAVLPVGGPNGAELVALLADTDLELVPVTVAQGIRSNLSLVEPDGTVTKVNDPGPQLSSDEVDALLDGTIAAAEDAGWIAGCGSLPPGAPVDLYARLIHEAHRAGVRVAIDSSGEALAAAVEAKPDLIKPNREELEELSGIAVERIEDARDAAAKLCAAGVGRVLVTLGASGALLVTPDRVLHAVATVEDPRSTVGAGDASLAGFLSQAQDDETALVTATAWGAAAVRLPGTTMPGPGDIDLSAVTTSAEYGAS